ncbi:MAG TPA: sugar phosphate isomerase/epimerase family protein [Jatrophihabitans sp.]|jgi:sugar phosphate isomerase/epimerase|uniref:sugar phosphate isomerase/epimerase family protein n=1 Tax=Jatrophihabitans sp. TaxID=1932789 RepID=UPI002EEE422D
MRLACQEQLLPGVTLEEKFEWAQDNGWDAIELRGKGNLSFRDRLPELRRARRCGVQMPTVCVEMAHFIGAFDAELRADAVKNMTSQLSVIAEIGGRGAMTPASWGMFSYRLPPFTPPRTAEEDRKVLVESLSTLGSHAQREGVELYLEPLNRYEDHMVNRLQDAVSLIEEIGCPAIKVVADFFHMDIEETDISASLRAAFSHLGHLQVSDSNRLEPGAGHLDWAPAIATLTELGYDGYYALESRLSGPAEQVIPAAAAFLRSTERR